MKTQIIAFFAVIFPVLVTAQNWPQAGGPKGDFVVGDGEASTAWSVALDQNIDWKKTLPELGQSSVTVWGDKIFFSINQPVKADTQLSKDIVAYCCSATDGTTLWTRGIEAEHPLKIGSTYGDSTGPSPVTNGKQVAFFNASGAIEGFDMAGNRLWRREALTAYRGSPFLIGNLLIYVQMNWEPEGGGYPHPKEELPTSKWTQAQAIDIETGKPVWSTECGGNIGSQPMSLKLEDDRDVFLLGRGGGHAPPEHPLGVSLVDARDGSEIWKLAIEGYECRQTLPLYHGQTFIIHNKEHWWVDIDSGEVTRKVSITDDVMVRRRVDDQWISETVDLETSSKTYQITNQSNLFVGGYHFFRNYLHNYLGRVNTDTGEVEYLQLPVSMLREAGQSDRFLWNEGDQEMPPIKNFKVPTPPSYWTFRQNTMLNSRGHQVMGDVRSQGNGWGHVAAPIPTAIGEHLYVPIMNGMVFVIDWDAEEFDEKAIVSINDLGPLGDAWTRGNLTFSNGKLFTQTIRELICIGK